MTLVDPLLSGAIFSCNPILHSTKKGDTHWVGESVALNMAFYVYIGCRSGEEMLELLKEQDFARALHDQSDVDSEITARSDGDGDGDSDGGSRIREDQFGEFEKSSLVHTRY